MTIQLLFGMSLARTHQCLRVNVCAQNVPTRSEAGLVEDYRSLGIDDDAVAMADYEAAGGLADVDAVVAQARQSGNDGNRTDGAQSNTNVFGLCMPSRWAERKFS
jgi:hypothetical protein